MKYLILSITCLFAVSAQSRSLAPDCNIKVHYAKNLILEDGTVENEAAFLKTTAAALKQCQDDVAANKTLLAFALLGEQNCEERSDQMSQLFTGYCFLKVADAVSWMK